MRMQREHPTLTFVAEIYFFLEGMSEKVTCGLI